MQGEKGTKQTTDVYGKKLNVKWVSLGSVFRQVSLSRPSLNYFHYVRPISVLALLCSFSATLLKNQNYFENLSSIWFLAAVSLLIMLAVVYLMATEIVEESLQIIDTFGVQITSKNRLNRKSKIFYDFSCLRGVIINEAITWQRVIFYLALLVGKADANNAECLVNIFKNTIPRVDVIKEIYNEIRPYLSRLKEH